AREKFALYIKDGDINLFADELPIRIANDFTEMMKLLQDKDFQDLLVNYPRAKREFYKAYELEDQVTSEELFGDDKTAEDYLDAFANFVKANQAQIAAIQILMERPKEWETKVLEELRKNLRKNKFPPEKLQKAHERVYHKALADIISMVKHAAREAEPIFNAEERVTQAMEKFMAGKSFDDEQLKWLGFIKEHLIQNLSLEMDDFEVAPVFERNGGLGKARKIFGQDLQTVVEEINYRIAA
ncbi:MAG: type I restriction-modification enzyme R subunit C-terminal domain-containing protein, partial [bacterium]